MRSREFIVERDEWMHMDPPEVAKWRNELRVQDIKSGPESTFSMTAPTSTRKDSRLPLGPDSLFAGPSSPSDTTANKKYNSELYKDAPNDEYRAAAPKKWGGKNSPPDQTELEKQSHRRNQEVSNDYMQSKKSSDWYNIDDIKKQRKVPPNLPGGMKEKYRT